MSHKHLEEARMIDLSDTQLCDLLLYLYESGKRLEEHKKTDPHIEKVRGELAAYVKEKYSDTIKEYRGKLKAARALAEARGIEWKAPEGLK